MTARTRRKSSAARPNTAKILSTRRSSRRTTRGAKEESCTCGDPDVSTPMIRCGECRRWYHFRCVELTEREAEDLATFVCPKCSAVTGKKSKEHWELDDTELAALHVEDEPMAHDHLLSHSSDEDEGSEDNFVAEPEEAVVAEEPPSDFGHTDEEEGIGARIHRRGARKRRSISKQVDAPTKRRRTNEPGFSDPPTAAEDPIRKSCLTLLVNLLTPIFSERLPDEPDPPVEAGNAEKFATELEACVFEVYAEPSEFDGKAPGNKYKERIRMLNFNLGKKDRTELRQSIRVGKINPDELSRMSSIDLANSQAQQEAHKLAEEAMNHSILQARTAPLRKITHKGEQMIEQSVEAENWRMQEEESAREREHELQRARSNTTGSVTEGERPHARSLSGSFNVTSFESAPTSAGAQPSEPAEKAFDPASAVFNVDFDGEGSNLVDNRPPTPPGLSGEPIHSSDNVLGDGFRMSSPTSTSVSPMAQNFSLDGIFGASEPIDSMWNDTRESEGSTGAPSNIGDDPAAPPDDTDFDAFITVDEDEMPEPQPQEPKEPSPPAPAEPPVQERTPSLADVPAIWRGHVGMPSIQDPTRMIRFQSEFKQIGGAPFLDVEENRRALFPASLFEIIGRVPTQQAVNYLVSMRLNPTKEIFACVLIPSEEDKPAYLELHKVLVGKDRYGLIFPWGQDPPLSAPGKELYIAPLLPEHPIPEYLQLLDNVTIPAQRDSPIFCGIFVLSKGRVTSLNPIDHARSVPPPSVPPVTVPPSIGSIPPIPPAAPVSLPGLPPVVAPALATSLSSLSESSLATLSKDLANLTPGQLELVRSLLMQQAAPVPTPAPAPAPAPVSAPAPSAPAEPLAPVVPPVVAPHPHVPLHVPPSHQTQGASGPPPPSHPPPGRSPVHEQTPASWDRPRASYPERIWEPGPGAAHYVRDEFRGDRSPYGRNDFRDDRPNRGRGPGPSRYRGRGGRGGSRW